MKSNSANAIIVASIVKIIMLISRLSMYCWGFFLFENTSTQFCVYVYVFLDGTTSLGYGSCSKSIRSQLIWIDFCGNSVAIIQRQFIRRFLRIFSGWFSFSGMYSVKYTAKRSAMVFLFWYSSQNDLAYRFALLPNRLTDRNV